MSEGINDDQKLLDGDSTQAQPANDDQKLPKNDDQKLPKNDDQKLPKNDSTNPYQTIIEQQQAQINALIAQTTALNNQIVSMVTSGAQLNDKQPAQQTQQTKPASLSDDVDYSLESLAKEIGRKNG